MMQNIIEWRQHPHQEAQLGYVGSAHIFTVMPWPEEAHRWPWQLQILERPFAPVSNEYVMAARSQREAIELAEFGAACFLGHHRLVPAPFAQVEALTGLLDRKMRYWDVAEERRTWLKGTGWFEPLTEEAA